MDLAGQTKGQRSQYGSSGIISVIKMTNNMLMSAKNYRDMPIYILYTFRKVFIIVSNAIVLLLCFIITGPCSQ